MPRRSPYLKKFWTWKKVALVVIVGFSLVNVTLAATYKTPAQFSRVTIPIIFGQVPVKTGDFPINQTAVTQYTTDLLSDYDSIIAKNNTNLASTQHFFTLYRPTGNFEVEVGRENATASDVLEFLFVPTQDQNLQVVVVTNESAEYLRPVQGTHQSANKFSIAPWQTPYGVALYQYYTQSALGERLIPLVWITNSTDVYGNVAINANNAAQTLYQNDVSTLNYELNPPYPSIGWFENVWNSDWGYLVAFSVVFGIATGAVYLRREGVWPFHSQSPQE